MKNFINYLLVLFKIKKAPICKNCVYYNMQSLSTCNLTYKMCSYYVTNPKTRLMASNPVDGDVMVVIKDEQKCTKMRDKFQGCGIHGRFWEKKEEVKNG